MSTALDQLINRKQTFEGELERIEDRVGGSPQQLWSCSTIKLCLWLAACTLLCLNAVQLYELETAYLNAEHSQCGTVLKVSGDLRVFDYIPTIMHETQAIDSKNLQPATCQRVPEQGFEGFLSSKDALRKRNRQLKPEDRSFSLCSVTSPAVRSWRLLSHGINACALRWVGFGILHMDPHNFERSLMLQTVELEQAMQDPVNDVLGVYGGRGKGKGKGFGKGNMPGKGSRR
jgi:hypothetical protein